jgi:amino acid adenylation domain-containing protein
MNISLLPQAVDYAADRLPDHEAVRYYDDIISYSDLATKTNRLARFLYDQGVRRGDRVGIYCFKSIEAMIALWGIMKAGAVYVPIDPLSPSSRVKAILLDCNIKHLIIDSEKRSTVKDVVENGVELNTIIGVPSGQDSLSDRCATWEDVFNTPGESQLQKLQVIEQDLAYIIYTSGSTGEPKGIMHTHHSGLSYAHWTVEEYKLTHHDRIANHAPFHFDISLFDIFGGAIAGASVVLVPKEVTLFPANFSQLLQDERISVIFTVPFAFIQLSVRGGLDQRDLSALRWVIFGGEPFPPKHLRTLMDQIPGSQFSNIYGPAEVNGVTFFHVPPIPENSMEPIPIGKMCSFAQSLILDEHDEIVSPGNTGEIVIRSPSMMQGYWGRTDLNSRAFYRREAAPEYFELYYRTGDLVKMLPDGNMLFAGRKDRQIKTRGYRVEMDEVEAALISHPGVEEAATFVIQDDDGNNFIHDAVIPKADEPLSETFLSTHLTQILPSYAIPVKYHIRQTFPRTTSGKISRRLLQREVMGME